MRGLLPQPGNQGMHICVDKVDNGYLIIFPSSFPGQMGRREVYTQLTDVLNRAKEYFSTVPGEANE